MQNNAFELIPLAVRPAEAQSQLTDPIITGKQRHAIQAHAGQVETRSRCGSSATSLAPKVAKNYENFKTLLKRNSGKKSIEVARTDGDNSCARPSTQILPLTVDEAAQRPKPSMNAVSSMKARDIFINDNPLDRQSNHKKVKPRRKNAEPEVSHPCLCETPHLPPTAPPTASFTPGRRLSRLAHER